MPTPDEIAKVKVNLNNLIDLTNFVHSYAIDKINNAYDLQSQPQNDAGQAWADALIGGAIWVLGDFGFPGANLCAGLLSGVFTMYTSNTPPNLQGAFAEIWQRFDATFLQANMDLTTYYSDPVGNWDTPFTGPDGQQYTVGGLATATMPSKDENLFVQAAEGILKKFDYNLWQETLKAAWYQWEGSNDPMLFPENKDWDAAGWARGFVKEHPAYYITWQWYEHDGNCCSEQHGYNMREIWLGQNASIFSDAAAPKNLCDYLFQDDGGGTIVNPGAITTRADVFSNFGLTHKTFFVQSTPSIGGEAFAERSGRTIQELLGTMSRQQMEAIVQERAAKDPAFYYELCRRPKEALAAVLGLKIPDFIRVEVHPEAPDTVHIVLPLIGKKG